jgi:hypothetical protein
MITNSEFLKALYPNEQSTWVATFPDWNNQSWVAHKTRIAEPNLSKHSNNYFTPATLASNAVRRTTEYFKELSLIVIDDPKNIDAFPEPTYLLETSKGNYQMGFKLSTPIASLEEAQRWMDLLGKGKENDTSGNNPVRWVRLPEAINNKHNGGEVFNCQLVKWNPAISFNPKEFFTQLQDILGLNQLEVNEKTDPWENKPYDFETKLKGIATADNFHGNLVSLSSHYVAKGISEKETIAILETAMNASEVQDDRWQDRFKDIPRIVKTAYDKFGFSEIVLDAEDSQEKEVIYEDIDCPKPYGKALTQFVNATLEQSPKKQPEITLLSGLIAMSSVVGGKYQIVNNTLGLNLYGLFIGETATGKEKPRERAVSEVSRLGVYTTSRATSRSAIESIFEQDNTRALLEIDEASYTFKAQNATNANSHDIQVQGVLLELFSRSGGIYTRSTSATKGKQKSVHRPHLNILAGSTPEKLGASLSQKDIDSGLLPRFLFVKGNDQAELQQLDGNQQACLFNIFAQEVNSLYDNLDSKERYINFEDSQYAWQKQKQYDQLTTDSQDQLVKTLGSRNGEKMLRISAVLAVFDNPEKPIITNEILDWSCSFVDYSLNTVLAFAEKQVLASEIHLQSAKALEICKRYLAGKIKGKDSFNYQQLKKQGLVPRREVVLYLKTTSKGLEEIEKQLILQEEIGLKKVLRKTDKGLKETLCWEIY